MRKELSEVSIMSKQLSTYDRKMKDHKFKKTFQKSYKELLFSELLVSIMEGDDISIRQLATEAKLSASVIQDLRSGKQHDVKLSNLIKIAHAFGYEIILQKGENRFTLQEKIRNSKIQLSVIAAA